jgi:hypothetical protein
VSWRLAAGTLALFFCLAARGVNITGFSPASGQPGNVITINGSGFTGTTMVQFNNNSTPTLGDFTNVSDGQLLVVVPQGASSGPLVVFVGNSSATSGASFLVAPVITGFAPQSGANPTVVSVFGANFVNGGTTVIFPGTSTPVPATYLAANEVAATVPVGAGNGPITVITSAGTNVSAGIFQAASTPTISSFTPTAAAIGATVNIFGGNFFSGATVKFGTVSATSFTIVSTTEITATIPTGASTGPITVTTSDGSATTTSNLLTGTGPIVTGFSPTIGSVNTTVTLNGLNLTTVSGVTFNGYSERILSYVGTTNLQVGVTNNSGTGPIKVTWAGGSYTTSNSFTNSTAPIVFDFHPTLGPVGSTVTIDGDNFTTSSQVKFGSYSATTTMTGEGTQLSATVPSSVPQGGYAITVTGSPNFVTTSNFTVTGAAPVITGFTPAYGVAGTAVTLTGANFGGSGLWVKFNGVAASYQTPTSTTELIVTNPVGTSSGLITAGNSSGSSPGPAIYYMQPWITALNAGGGIVNSTLTITGRSLTNTSSVQVNGINYNFTSSATQIAATIPSNATTGLITITSPGGIYISTSNFAILPKIYGFSPNIGPAGTLVTINGTSLFDVTSVQFGGVGTPVANPGTNQLQVAVPAGADSGPLTVVTPYGNDISTNSFIATKPSLVVLSNTVSPLVAFPGSNVTYTLLLTNEGPSIVTSVVVTDTVPLGFSFQSASASLGSWTYNDNNGLVWTLPFLTNGTAATLQFTGTSTTAGAMTNYADGGFAEGELPGDFGEDDASVKNYFLNASRWTLSIARQATPPAVVLTWPASPANFVLQINTTTTLDAGWLDLAGTIYTTNGLNFYTNSINEPQSFFRLRLNPD